MTRHAIVLAALTLPALLSAVGLLVTEAWRVVQPTTPMFTPPPASTLAQAIDEQDLHQAYTFLVAGHHPEEPVEVQHRILTGGEPIRMPPLVWAVAVRNAGAVQMLLSLGARLDGAAERRTPCLAEAVGNEALAAMLRRYGADPGGPCLPLPADRPPLIAYLAATRALDTPGTSPTPR